MKKFQIRKTKCAYLINYGIASYFRNNFFLKGIKDSPCFSFFDVTLNRAVKEEHMDDHIRYFKDASVSTRSVL